MPSGEKISYSLIVGETYKDKKFIVCARTGDSGLAQEFYYNEKGTVSNYKDAGVITLSGTGIS